MQRMLLLLFATTLVTCVVAPDPYAQTIKLGEINEYKQFPAFLEPYRRAWSSRSTRSTRRAACWAGKLEIVLARRQRRSGRRRARCRGAARRARR